MRGATSLPLLFKFLVQNGLDAVAFVVFIQCFQFLVQFSLSDGVLWLIMNTACQSKRVNELELGSKSATNQLLHKVSRSARRLCK